MMDQQENSVLKLKGRISKLLFYAAKSKLLGNVIGLVFEKLTWTIPVSRQYEDRYIIAFLHPVPTWKNHILIVPKMKIPSFLFIDFNQQKSKNKLVKILNSIYTYKSKNKRIKKIAILNGGKYQEVMQMHFHFIDKSVAPKLSNSRISSGKEMTPNSISLKTDSKCFNVINSTRKFHMLISTKKSNIDEDSSYLLLKSLEMVQHLIIANSLDRFSIFIDFESSDESDSIQLNLVSG